MRTVRNRAARWAAALLAVLTAAGTAACAGPPSKGDLHGVTLNQSRNNVFILAREPSAAMPPIDLVNNFLQALTGDQKDPTFSVAQEYLTPSARSKWNPGTATTRIVQYASPALDVEQNTDPSEHPAAVQSGAPQAAATPAVGDQKTVTVKGTEIAQIDPYGFFKYLTQPVSQQFTVKYLGAGTGWRIDQPGEYRMVNPDAFKRAYQTYQSALPVYLDTRGAAPQMDQVYLTQATGKVDYIYDALARAVLHGRYPSQNTQLTLASQVSVDSSGQATVMLNPPGGTPDIASVQNALYQTFRDAAELPQLLSPTPLTGVLVTYAGCSGCREELINPLSTGPPTVYWVCPQQQNDSNAAIVSKQLVSGQPNAPAACPANGTGKTQSVVSTAGVQLAKNAPIAVKQIPDSADVKTPSGTLMVAAVKADGEVVVLNDKNADQGTWYTAKDPKKITDLEWDPADGSLWVVDAGSLYRVQDPGDKGRTGATQQFTAVPGGALTRFKPSPDGLRAILVSGQSTSSEPASAGSPFPATMVSLERVGDAVTLSSDSFQLLAGYSQTQDSTSPDLQSVADAAWSDGRTAVLLGTQGSSGTLRLYRVYLDGTQDSSIPDAEDAQPAAWHLGAVTTLLNGHPSLWTFSDAPGPTDPNTAMSYFKRSGGVDSFQESGWSPVMATVTGD